MTDFRTESGATNDTRPAQVPSAAGTYILVGHIPAPFQLKAGRLDPSALPAGSYLYVGSAHGPGGLYARIMRHLRPDKPRHWHIDYLTQLCPAASVWFYTGSERLECQWAQATARVPGIQAPIPGFGASDCACITHLFVLPEVALPGVWMRVHRLTPGLQRYDT